MTTRRPAVRPGAPATRGAPSDVHGRCKKGACWKVSCSRRGRRWARAGASANAEIQLLLCATYAVGDTEADARFARARVTEAERADPVNAQSLAGCAALLGETETALRTLESMILRRLPLRADRFLRDLYLSNEWDRLRGNPRFESLFPR
jgi:hypothetical protein